MASEVQSSVLQMYLPHFDVRIHQNAHNYNQFIGYIIIIDLYVFYLLAAELQNILNSGYVPFQQLQVF